MKDRKDPCPLTKNPSAQLQGIHPKPQPVFGYLEPLGVVLQELVTAFRPRSARHEFGGRCGLIGEEPGGAATHPRSLADWYLRGLQRFTWTQTVSERVA